MPNDEAKYTPVPTGQFVGLVTAVARIDTNIKSIKEEMLPPLARDTQEARDKAREALTKVNGHIADTDSHEHPCVEKPRQERQDQDLGDLKGTKEKVENTSKLVWWLMGIAVATALSVGGFTWATRVITAENASSIRTNVGDIAENKTEVKALREAQQRDRETFIREVRGIPAQVEEAAKARQPSVDDFEDAAGDLPLTEREQTQLLQLLKRARQRGSEKATDGDG